MTNVVVVQGRLSRPAAVRVLATGQRQLELQLSGTGPAGSGESVPVVWPDAPAAAESLDAGEEVTVVGRVRRRFFRTGGATASRTEVVADEVVLTRHARRARAAVARAAARLPAAPSAERAGTA